jgi:hypothetical protein
LTDCKAAFAVGSSKAGWQLFIPGICVIDSITAIIKMSTIKNPSFYTGV